MHRARPGRPAPFPTRPRKPAANRRAPNASLARAGRGDLNGPILKSRRPNRRCGAEPRLPAASLLFAPPPADDPGAADPALLARAATLAAGRAMQRRLWGEARALAALAESYARLGRATPGGGQTIETMDLRLLHAILTDDTGAAMRRMAPDPDRDDEADRALKAAYQQQRHEAQQAAVHHEMALMRRIHAAERQVRALGGEVTVSQSGFEAAAEARAWLLEQAADLDRVTVTPSPPPGDPWAVGL